MDKMQYKEVLLNIAHLSTEEHLRNLRFVIKHLDGVTPKKLEECKSLIDVFDYLEKLDHANYQKTETLVYYLTQIFRLNKPDADPDIKGLVDVLSGDVKLQQRQGIIPPSGTCQLKVAPIPVPVAQCIPQPVIDHGLTVSEETRMTNISEKLRSSIEYTAKHIGDGWIDFGRLAGIPETEIRDLEIARITMIEKARRVQFAYVKLNSKINHKHIRNILRKIPRNDIADELKEQFG